MHVDRHAEIFELAHHIHDAGVAHVGAVFLERDAQHQRPRTGHRQPAADQQTCHALGHVATHAVVDAPASQDHFRVVADFLRLVREVIRIDADAVTADQARSKRQEIPLGAGRFQHFRCVDAEPVEDQRQLVDQGDVQIALGVLDHLGRLRDADAAGAVGFGDGGVQRVHVLGRRRRGTGGDLGHRLQAVLAVTGIDALGAVADEKIAVQRQAGFALQDRCADFLGRARIHRGFVNHHIAGFQNLPHGAAGRQQGPEVRSLVGIHRRWHGDDIGVAVGQISGLTGQTQGARPKLRGAHLAGRVMPGVQDRDALAVDVEAKRGKAGGQRHRQRQADIAESKHTDTCLCQCRRVRHVPASNVSRSSRSTVR
nr:D639 [uncultured bacterium]